MHANIWVLWLNFKDLTVEKFNNTIIQDYEELNTSDDIFLKQMIRMKTEEQKIFYINKFEYLIQIQNDISNSVDKQRFKDILTNPNIGAAHKSDYIRFYLLYLYGGIWIDASTFIIQSLAFCNDFDFVVPYVTYGPFFQFLLRPGADAYDDLSTSDNIEWVKMFYKSTFNVKKVSDYPYVPENWFICANKEHDIIRDVIKNLNMVWDAFLTKKGSIGSIIRKDIRDNLKTIDIDINLKHLEDDMYSKMYLGDGYLFNYLQLHVALSNYLEKNKQNVKTLMDPFEIVNSNQIDLKVNGKSSNMIIDKDHIEYLCKTSLIDDMNMCTDVIITTENNHKILLFSANIHRLFKWSNLMVDRINGDNTLISKMLTNAKVNESNINDIFKKYNQRVVKFGSWTRDSNLVNTLYKAYEVSGGGNNIKLRVTKKTMLIQMNIDQLKALAFKHNIPLKKLKLKADIINKLEHYLRKNDIQ